MTQYMRFKHGSISLSFGEIDTSGKSDVLMHTGTDSATMTFDEHYLKELSEWINLQLSKISNKKQATGEHPSPKYKR